MFVASILWLLLNQTLLSFPYFIIYQFISKKPTISVTLVDLLYRDTIIYVYAICLSLSAAIIHCLACDNDTLTLSYSLATAYSTVIQFFFSCTSISLIFSACLRLISIVKKSEAAGLQLLGPDNIALNKIRFISTFVSFISPCLIISLYKTQPGLFPLFYNNESTSFVQDLNTNSVKGLYLVLPCSAAVVNIFAKISSNFAKNKINPQVEVFTICGSNIISSEKNFTLSIGAAIGIPLLILFGFFLSSFADRVSRLTFFVPVQIMLLGCIIPIFVIKSDPKITNFVKQNYIKPFLEIHLIRSLIKWKSPVIPFQERGNSFEM